MKEFVDLIPAQITWCQIAPLLRGKFPKFWNFGKKYLFSFASDWSLGIRFASSAFSRICLLLASFWLLETYLTLTLHLTTNNSSCLLPLGCLSIISNLSCLKSNTMFFLKISPFLEIFSVNGKIIWFKLTFLLDSSLSANHNCQIWSSPPLTATLYLPRSYLLSFFLSPYSVLLTIFWTSDVFTDLRVCALILPQYFFPGVVFSRILFPKTFAYLVPFNH